MMEILLDTCTFLWIISDDERLPENARRIFSDTRNTVYLSTASAWEIAVKYSIGKLPLAEDPRTYIPRRREEHQISKLDICEEAALHLIKLPPIHKDPFDRMLICQSIVSGCTILTPDPLIHQYPVKCFWK